MPANFPKPFREERPWGNELWITKDYPLDRLSMVKMITVNAGESLSLQFHHNRDEYWHMISGNGMAEIGDSKITLEAGTDCFVPRELKHRVTGGTEPLVFLELAFGDFDEKDIVRLEDRYGRT